ncbi:hypothetical protein B1A67_02865 [Clostridium botulinum D/C]|nr:hypothetical protein B1A66_04860 [Clostridium botulinum D/C]OOV55460.1 hypothetical protein B0673_08695 [Clostridium botulinum D/C]OOV58744.1 hypothetical protein B1A67_02865 [Clostridium botulinum D/C]OOV60949.1 hypothetical protein B1A68_00060 [Clostridium botulinum D/C]OOV62456.1 hypothetical protein B1A69_04390 [Clostridium botulinum D/C]
MYAGISGMKVNQTKLDVTGNNIANVSTTGFKSSRVRFKDMLSQNMGEAVGPGRNQGGVNGKQVGLGVQVAGIDTVMSQGMMQPTSRNLDVAMDGTGYLIVGKGPLEFSNDKCMGISNHTISDNPGGMGVQFTRDGALTLDYQGNLLTSDGYRVLGYSISNDEGSVESIQAERTSDQEPGQINFVNADGDLKDEYGHITVENKDACLMGNTVKYPNDLDLDKKQLSLIVDGKVKNVNFSFEDPATKAGRKANLDEAIKQINDAVGASIASKSSDGRKIVLKSQKSLVIMDNPAEAAAELRIPNGKDSITLGGLKVDGVQNNKVINAMVHVTITGGAGSSKGAAAVDSEGNIVAVYEVDNTGGTDNIKWDTAKVADDSGNLYKEDGTIEGKVDPKSAKGKLKAIDVKVKTQKLKPLRIPDKVLQKVIKEDGSGFEYKEVKIRSFSIEKSGLIKGILDDGRVTALGQIGMASFKNPEGLKKMGKNLYSNTANSGEVTVRSGLGADPKDDNSAGYGEMLQGMLEMSNVDLAEQFTDMIVTTRAFQASGKMISTGDEILQDIINLKR